uniref:Cilia- and flagella-associated protein 126 n=1 Tax=Strigamia maritima TaxID=126957 RepID=T1J7F3_STRMM
MAVVYHSGQYEKPAGIGPRSEAWDFRKKSQKPKTLSGYTVFISDDKGHFLNPKKKSPISHYSWYAGTWDLPCEIPANISTLTGYSDETASRLKEKRINWTNDLKRVWLRLDPKYKKLVQHFRGTPGSKDLIKLPSKFEDLGVNNHWEFAGIHEDVLVHPQQTISSSFLKKFRV